MTDSLRCSLAALCCLLAMMLISACGGGSGTDGAKPPPAASSAPVALGSSTFTGHNTRLIGRFDTSRSGEARFAWSGSAIEFTFTGTAATLGIQDNALNRFQVEVDGQAYALATNYGSRRYTLASGLAEARHTVRVTRISSAPNGVTAFVEDPRVQGTIEAPSAAPAIRLLVIGDSITAGSGVIGEGPDCPLDLASENQQQTYAAVAARELGADLHSISWPGIGVWRGYGETQPKALTMPTLEPRTLPEQVGSSWTPASYQPQAVMINLGTNDFWSGDPSAEFTAAMRAFLSRLASDYPAARFYLLPSATLLPPQRALQLAALSGQAGGRITVLDIGKIEPADGLGCIWHPNAVTHARMGAALASQLRADLAL